MSFQLKIWAWSCSAWSRLQRPSSTCQYQKKLQELDRDFWQGHVGTGPGGMASNWKKEYLYWILGRNSLLWGWSDTGTGCPEKLGMPNPWKCSQSGWVQLWVSCSSGRCPCPWQEVGTRWSPSPLPTQTILWWETMRDKSSIWWIACSG